jgi:hypothetical protein
MATRYSGNLVVHIEIFTPENHKTETHWYRMRTSTRRSEMKPLDPYVRYYSDVHLSLGEREKLAEDNPRCFDAAARFALSFADEYGLGGHLAELEQDEDGAHVGRQLKYAWRRPPLSKKALLALGPEDEVYWNDPDKGCSRFYKIKQIEVRDDGVVIIEEEDGSLLECYAKELS